MNRKKKYTLGELEVSHQNGYKKGYELGFVIGIIIASVAFGIYIFISK